MTGNGIMILTKLNPLNYFSKEWKDHTVHCGSIANGANIGIFLGPE